MARRGWSCSPTAPSWWPRRTPTGCSRTRLAGARPSRWCPCPGRPVRTTCHEGVDGIAWDAGTRSLVVPDPVTGTVYRVSPDGRSRLVLGTGFVHPVGAAVGQDGSVYVADECGG